MISDILESETSSFARHYSRRDFLKSATASAMFAMALPAAKRVVQQGRLKKMKKPPSWKIHNVAKIPNGYQVAVADVNGDGRPDILALSSEQRIVEWYENPGWKVHPITTKTDKNINLAPLFRPSCPSQGIALAADFHLDDSARGGSLWWSTPPSPPEVEWHLKSIGELPTAHRLRWADLDGDGLLELVVAPIIGAGAHAPGYAVAAPLTWFAMPEAVLRVHASPAAEIGGAWEPHLIDDTLTVVHGLQVLDWDGDGRDEIMTASFEGVHLFHSTGRGEKLHWTKVRLGLGDQSPKLMPGHGGASEEHRGSSEIGVGNIRGRRYLATIEPWHGDQVVVYFEERCGDCGGLWKRHIIDSSFRDGHALVCADFDGDGDDEIVAGFRGAGTSLYYYFTNDPASLEWERQTLDTDMAASGVVADDINGDGRLDVVAIGASTGNVMWYENLG